MVYLALKALHIIGFTAWMAGLFYLVRMFVYHTEAYDEAEPKKSILSDRYALMEQRVYQIICNPAMILTWGAGIAMIMHNGLEWLSQSAWLHIKLILVVLLTIYHIYCKKLIGQLAIAKTGFTSFQFRLFNEVPALFLIAIVIFAIFKNGINSLYALLIVVGSGILFYIFAKAYKRNRESKK